MNRLMAGVSYLVKSYTNPQIKARLIQADLLEKDSNRYYTYSLCITKLSPRILAAIWLRKLSSRLAPQKIFLHSSALQLWTTASIIIHRFRSLIGFTTYGRTPWMSDKLIARPVPTQGNTT
jgi:hypothetical protein